MLPEIEATGRDWRTDPRPGDVIQHHSSGSQPRVITGVADHTIGTVPTRGAARRGHRTTIRRGALDRYRLVAEAGPAATPEGGETNA